MGEGAWVNMTGLYGPIGAFLSVSNGYRVNGYCFDDFNVVVMV